MLLLEARDRVCGRIWTNSWHGAFVYRVHKPVFTVLLNEDTDKTKPTKAFVSELGAEWIHTKPEETNTTNPVEALAEMLDLKLKV